MEQKYVKELKENKVPFGLMSEEMKRAMVCDFKKSDIEYFEGPAWIGKDEDKSIHGGFTHSTTYRLLASYKPEPEVVKCEVHIGEIEHLYKGDLIYNDTFNKEKAIDLAIRNPDFIGFLYEDGAILPIPRKYTGEGAVKMITGLGEGSKVLTPTHVLFRKGQ